MAGRLRLLTSCALALALLTACGGDPKPRGRVLLVGIDGATLRVALPLLRAGRLPNLGRIGRDGVYGQLLSHPAMVSPRIWTSIATGKTPQHHGIENFSHKDANGVERLYLSSDRRGPALWNILSDAGLRVGVINWWMTYPLERVRGVMVSDHLLSHAVWGYRKLTGSQPVAGGPIVHPDRWEKRVQDLALDPRPLTSVPDPFADATHLPAWARPETLSQHYADDGRIARIALEVEREEHPDLLMVFFPGIDRVSHVIWAAVEPESAYPRTLFGDGERSATASAFFRYYEYTDALIGRLLEAYGPEDLVMVVSDHGFEAGEGRFANVTGVHKSSRARLGVVFASGPDIAPPADSSLPTSVNDVTPTILAWLGMPVADDMDGRPAPFLTIDSGRIRRIASYDDVPVERLEAAPSGAEEAILEQLRALGYLEDEAP